MKKVSIITLHRVKNYGSFLQAFATQIKIKQLGYDTEIVDYIPERMTIFGMLKAIKNKKNILKRSLLLRSIARLIMIPSYFKRFKVFNGAVDKYLDVTKITYHNEKELEENIPTGDIYLTGSDQTWNSSWNGGIDYPLFLEYAPKNKKKISYAASFGKSKLDSWEVEETKKLLKKYSFLGIREKSGVDICKKIGYDASLVLDPTLLLDGNEWRKYKSSKFSSEKYILIYNLNRNKKIDKYAKNISKKTGLKIKYLSYQWHEFYKFGKMCYCPSIEDFLSLIDNAEFVVTDSFHATAFSINFNKNFMIVFPDKYSSRVKSILEITKLENRIVEDVNDINLINQNIRYNNVNKIISEQRIESYRLLKLSLEEK